MYPLFLFVAIVRRGISQVSALFGLQFGLQIDVDGDFCMGNLTNQNWIYNWFFAVQTLGICVL